MTRGEWINFLYHLMMSFYIGLDVVKNPFGTFLALFIGKIIKGLFPVRNRRAVVDKKGYVMQKKIMLGVLAICIAFGTATYAKSGDLDNSFGSDGKVTTKVVGLDTAYSVAIQKDGKIVVVGFSKTESDNDFAMVRYNSDGSLDSKFGSSGIVTTDIGGSADVAHSVAIQKDGKIVVAGWSNSSGWDFAIVRYNSDGTLDGSFGSGGIVTTDIENSIDGAYSIAIQNDGKIVAAGSSGTRSDGSDNDFAIVRYNTNGGIDNSFGSDGKVTTPVGSRADSAYSVTIQDNGKIVAAGTSFNDGGNYDFAIVRYNSNGGLDTSFVGDGKVTTNIGGYTDIARSVAIQKDGKIVAVGKSANDSWTDFDFAIVRYNSDGTLDGSFGSDGIVTTDIGSSEDYAYGVVIQKDSKIVAVGYSRNGNNNDFTIVRYMSIGMLDISFGHGGIVTTDIRTSFDYAYSVAIQKDGKIVAVGKSVLHGFAIVRYLGYPVVPLAPIYYLLQ